MAENRETLSSIDFGIESTELAGSYKAVDDFLSGKETSVTSPEDVEEIDENGEEDTQASKTKTKKPVPAKKEEKKPASPPADLLGDLKDEDGEEDEDEDKTEDGKGVKKEAPKEDGKEDEASDTLDIKAIATDLFNMGVFTPIEGEEDITKVNISSPEQLKARFQKEGQIQASSWLEGFLARDGEDRRDLFEAIFMDGVDPSEYLPVYNSIQDLKGLDITQESVQEKVYREFYSRIGWTEENINKKLQRTKDYGDLEDEAKDLYPQLLQQDEERAEEMRQTEKANKQKQLKFDNDYKMSVARILEEKAKAKDFDGIPINDEKKRKAFDFLYTKKYRNSSGQQLTEFDKFIIDTLKPENHAVRVKIALLALDGFDLTKVEKRALSKESSSLFQELAQKKTKKTGGASSAAPSDSKTHKINSWLDQL